MTRKKETCLCDDGTGCGYQEVNSAQTRALRAMGAVVKNGLGGRLPGHWVRACWIRAYDAQQRLVGTGTAIDGDTARVVVTVPVSCIK